MRSASSVAALPRRDRLVIAGCIALVTALAWTYLVHLGRGMSSSGGVATMIGMVMNAPWSASDIALTFVMWTVMMVGMMSPSAAPVLLLFADLQARRADGQGRRAVLAFALGYAAVWMAFSALAALAQWGLHEVALLSPAMAATSPWLGGALLIAAGAYQLTPAKGECLRHCQSPLGYIMSHWRDGAAGAFRMGLHHGRYCLGCCWALMGVLFVVGVMNLAWVGALTVFILLEKTGRLGARVSRVGGLAMIAAGVLFAVRAASAQQARAPRELAITHVTVIDVEHGARLADRTVVVRDGRITRVGDAASTAVPSGAATISGRGAFLIPGLWDMHGHPGREADLALYLANGVTGVRIMAGDTTALGWRRRIRAGALVGPSLHLAGPILEGPPPGALASVIQTDDKQLVRTSAEATAQVRAQKAAGYDFIKVYNNLSRPAYDAIVAEARRQGMRVAGHVPFAVGLSGVLAARQASVEHLRGYVERMVPTDAPQQPGADLRSRTIAWRFADTTRIPALVRETVNAGTWNVVTLDTRVYDGTQEEVERYLATSDTAFMSSGERAALHDRKRIPWLSNFTAEDFRLSTEGHAQQDALIRALRDAGAGLLAGTDIGPWGPSLHRELELLVGAGLTTSEALRAATLSPARYLGAADTLGAVAVGKRADLVVLDADPLADIRNTRRIRAVVAGGRAYAREALDAMLEGVQRSR